jgi:hypothetical protein
VITSFSKRIFLHLLHSNEDHEPTLVYPSLQTVNIPSPHIVDYDQHPLSESYDNLEQPCKFYEIKDDISSFVPILVSSKIQQRYKPLKFPSILHDFPPKHYKYLPIFDGEIENLTAEKHISCF